MNFYDWVSLITICVAGALSPGPSLIVILSISMKFGRKAGFSSAVGHGVAIFIYAISTGLGISFLLGTENNFFFFIYNHYAYTLSQGQVHEILPHNFNKLIAYLS